MTSTIKRRVAAATAAGGLLIAASIAGIAAAAPAATPGGTIHFWVTPGRGAVDKIVITGAIGDYGKATSITKSGKVDTNGSYVKVALKQGGFEVNAVAFNKKAGAKGPTVDKTTCSAWETVSDSVTLFNGTGAYAGISGKLSIQTSFAFIVPRFKTGAKKGDCNLSNSATPVAVFEGSITGSGKVSF